MEWLSPMPFGIQGITARINTMEIKIIYQASLQCLSAFRASLPTDHLRELCEKFRASPMPFGIQGITALAEPGP